MAGDFDPSDEDDEREVELCALQAIFPELVVDSSDAFSASLDIAVAPVKPFPASFSAADNGGATFLPPPPSESLVTEQQQEQEKGDGEPGVAQENQVHELSFLPPLQLAIRLPPGYPTEAPPQIELGSSWLPKSKLQELAAHARVAWEDTGRNQMLYDYIDYLQQAAEDGFGLVSADNAVVHLSPELEIGLLDYDLGQKRAKFEQETFGCGVCLEPKKGKVCHRLQLCGHVFCVACLQDFYNNCITEGDVANVRCLAPDCGGREAKTTTPTKKRRKQTDRTLAPSELLQIPLEQEMVQRYIKMKRKKELESDKSTIYCPRKWCQGAARPNKKLAEPEREVALGEESDEGEVVKPGNGNGVDEDENETESGEDEVVEDPQAKLPPPSERLAICSDCSFAFCSVCLQGWHGELVRCGPPRKKGELTEEERLSELYLALHSTPCPTCNARCQKSHGCNHMHCYNCGTHFCYLCSAWLDQSNPYEHFNTQGEPCYQRLWELEEGDDDRAQRGGHPPPPPPDRPAVVEIRLHNFNNNNNNNNNNNAVRHHDIAQAGRIAHQMNLNPPPPAAPAVPPALPTGILRGPPLVPPPAPIPPRRRLRPAGPLPAAVLPIANPQNGLQRFLALAQNDEEDEWDSDELEFDDED